MSKRSSQAVGVSPVAERPRSEELPIPLENCRFSAKSAISRAQTAIFNAPQLPSPGGGGLEPRRLLASICFHLGRWATIEPFSSGCRYGRRLSGRRVGMRGGSICFLRYLLEKRIFLATNDRKRGFALASSVC
jgi:hypothetical protein